jgi:hypothetical protein
MLLLITRYKINGNTAAFGECKWRKTQIGLDALENLKTKSDLFPEFTKHHYVLFSKSGFSSALKELAIKQGNVILVEIEDMFLVDDL